MLSKRASKLGIFHFVDFFHCQELKSNNTICNTTFLLYYIVFYCILLCYSPSLQVFRISLPLGPIWVGSNCILIPIMSPKGSVSFLYFTFNNRLWLNSLNQEFPIYHRRKLTNLCFWNSGCFKTVPYTLHGPLNVIGVLNPLKPSGHSIYPPDF